MNGGCRYNAASRCPCCRHYFSRASLSGAGPFPARRLFRPARWGRGWCSRQRFSARPPGGIRCVSARRVGGFPARCSPRSLSASGLRPCARAGRVGALLLPAYLLLPPFVARCWSSGRRREIGLAAWSAVVAATALWALVEQVRQGTPRSAMPLGHHNLLAAFLVITLPLVVPALRRRGPASAGWRWRRWWQRSSALVEARSFVAGAALALLALVGAARFERARHLVLGLALLGSGAARTARRGDRPRVRTPRLRRAQVYLRAGWQGSDRAPDARLGPGFDAVDARRAPAAAAGSESSRRSGRRDALAAAGAGLRARFRRPGARRPRSPACSCCRRWRGRQRCGRPWPRRGGTRRRRRFPAPALGGPNSRSPRCRSLRRLRRVRRWPGRRTGRTGSRSRCRRVGAGRLVRPGLVVWIYVGVAALLSCRSLVRTRSTKRRPGCECATGRAARWRGRRRSIRGFRSIAHGGPGLPRLRSRSASKRRSLPRAARAESRPSGCGPARWRSKAVGWTSRAKRSRTRWPSIR